MWQWLASMWRKVRGKKRRLSLLVGDAAYALTGGDSMPRKLRVSFPGGSFSASAGSFSLAGIAATLTYGQLAWKAVPPLSLVQGGTLDLTQYVNNPQNTPLTYSVATSTHTPGVLPTGVSLSPGGSLSATSSAELGTINISFNATTGSAQHQPLTASPGSFLLSGKTATLTGPTGPVVMTVDLIPYTGYGVYLTPGGSKNLIFAQIPSGTGPWYKVGGDHFQVSSTIQGQTPTSDGGRQEIFQINFATNDWSILKQKYYIRTGDNLGSLQMCQPDDPAGCIINGEFWYTSNNSNYPVTPATTDTMTNFARTNYGSDIVTQDVPDMMAWNPATGLWRVIGNYVAAAQSGRSWCAMYDASNNRLIIPTTWGICTLDCSQTPPVDITTLADQGFPSNTDLVEFNGRAYAYNPHYGTIMSLDLTTGPPFTTYYSIRTDVTIPSMQNVYQSFTTKGGDCVWYPPAQAFIIANALGMIAAWQPNGAPGQQVTEFPIWTTWSTDIGGTIVTFNVNRRDGWISDVDGHYVPPSKMIYDPVTQYCYSMGGISWDTSSSTNYWRLRFQ